MKCTECEHFKILYEPLKDKGCLWDLGRAKCMKYDLITDFASHSKFKRLSCQNTEREEKKMSRYIDADTLKEQAFGKRGGLIHTSDVDEAPTIDVVERKKGEWITKDKNATYGDVSTCVYYPPKCSVCGGVGEYKYNYCPNCGADMRQ